MGNACAVVRLLNCGIIIIIRTRSLFKKLLLSGAQMMYICRIAKISQPIDRHVIINPRYILIKCDFGYKIRGFGFPLVTERLQTRTCLFL